MYFHCPFIPLFDRRRRRRRREKARETEKQSERERERKGEGEGGGGVKRYVHVYPRDFTARLIVFPMNETKL